MNEAVNALKKWLENARAQHLAQYAAGSAAQYSEAVEHSYAMAHHPCIVRIRGYLQQIVDLLKSNRGGQLGEIDEALEQCKLQEFDLKNLIEMTESLRKILRQIEVDLECHQKALAWVLPEWRSQVQDSNPLNDKIVRNDTAQRRLESIAALIQSCQTSELQLSLMYNQMSRLHENLTTLRQVTFPIWQQKAINRTMVDDKDFLESLQQTIMHTGEVKL